ncbi:MAG: flagellar hook-associated protein FlgK [Candidatus Methylomirabilia bacterium]
MPGPISLLSLATQSLLAAQLAQQTAAANAANAATPGFSRRRVDFTEGVPERTASGFVGTGVLVKQIRRIRDSFLDSQVRADSSALAEAGTRATVLNRIGSIFGVLEDNPVGQALDEFFTALGDLASRPEDPAFRTTVLIRGQTLATTFKEEVESLLQIKRETFFSLGDQVNEVNSVTAQIARLNSQLTGGSNPTRDDERDRLIDRLAELVGVRVSVDSNGVAQVVLAGSGMLLVDGVRAATLTLSGNPESGSATLDLDGNTIQSLSGEVGALLSLRNSSTNGIPLVVGEVNTLAAGVIHAVNRVHASGVGLVGLSSATSGHQVSAPTTPLGSAGLPVTPVTGSFTIAVFDSAGAMASSGSIAVDPATTTLNSLATDITAVAGLSASVSGNTLTITPTNPTDTVVFGTDTSDTLVALGLNRFFAGTDARTMAVDSTLLGNPSLVAAAQLDLAGGIFSPGDPSNAQALAGLQSSRFLAGNTQTPAESLAALAGTIGALDRAAQVDTAAREVILTASTAQRESVSGVSLDEELADMVRFQQAFEASARFLATLNEMSRTLFDLL